MYDIGVLTNYGKAAIVGGEGNAYDMIDKNNIVNITLTETRHD